jgi:hypothetical protein
MKTLLLNNIFNNKFRRRVLQMGKSNNKIRKILNRDLNKKERGITLIALVVTIALNCCRSGRKKECIA